MMKIDFETFKIENFHIKIKSRCMDDKDYVPSPRAYFNTNVIC